MYCHITFIIPLVFPHFNFYSEKETHLPFRFFGDFHFRFLFHPTYPEAQKEWTKQTTTNQKSTDNTIICNVSSSNTTAYSKQLLHRTKCPTTPRAVAVSSMKQQIVTHTHVAHLSIENCLRIYKIQVIDLLMLSEARRR